MARKRFNAEEKTLLVPGAQIDWQNVSQWHPATVIGTPNRSDGWDSCEIRTESGTRTFSKGDVIAAGPGHVRARTS